MLPSKLCRHPPGGSRAPRLAVPGEYWSGIASKNVCLSLAAHDPAAAWAMLQRTPKNAEHEAGQAAGKLAALDFAGAAARIEKLPKSIKGYAEGAFAWERMKADPAAGWDWIRRQPDPAYLIQHTVGQTLRRDPDKAFALLSSLSPEQLTSVKEKWRLSFNLHEISLTSNVIAASTLAPEVKQTLAENFLFVAQQRDPAAATSLFAQMAPDAQVKKVGEFLTYWTAKDPAAAQAWRNELPEGPLREAAAPAPKTKTAPEAKPGSPPPVSLAQDLRVRN